MKRDHMCHGSTRVLQNLAHLQRIETQRLKSNANLHCAMAHKVESRFGNVTARRFDLVSATAAMLCSSHIARISTCGENAAEGQVVHSKLPIETPFDPRDPVRSHLLQRQEQNCAL
jgi:hypothetical protein